MQTNVTTDHGGGDGESEINNAPPPQSDHMQNHQETPPVIVKNSTLSPQLGDRVVVTATATWIRSGSDKLPWQEVPKSKRGAPEIPINTLGIALFDELMEGGRVIALSRGKVKVRNQRTGRTSIFPAQDVRVLPG